MVASKVSQFKNSAGKTVVVTYADVGLGKDSSPEQIAKARSDFQATRKLAKDGDAKARERMASYTDKSLNRQETRTKKDNKKKGNVVSLAKKREEKENRPQTLYEAKLKKGDIEGATKQTSLVAEDASRIAKEARRSLAKDRAKIASTVKSMKEKYPLL